MEDNPFENLNTEVNFDDLKSPSQELRDQYKTEETEAAQQEYVAALNMAMREGTMSRGLFNSLPKELRRRYKERHRNLKGHIAGVPMNAQERETDKRLRKKRAQKIRAAKQARKRNR